MEQIPVEDIELIDVKRAIEEERKITFVSASKNELVYTTSFGELFAIKRTRLGDGVIGKTALGIDYVTSIVIHNLEVERMVRDGEIVLEEPVEGEV